jgi:DNA-directed RNA polymerase subunit RPC12/RpoP
MESLQAKKLREEWGTKPCSHPKLVMEYYADTHTMDYVCTQCGAEFNVLEMLEIRGNQQKKRKQIA